MQEQTEELSLWRACCEGDARAKHDFAARYLPVLQKFLANKVDIETARDITSQTFERLFTGVILRYEGRSKLTTFILGVAYQCLREYIREWATRGGFVDPSEVSLATLCPTPSQVVAQDERQRCFLAAVRELSPEHQTLLELYYWNDYTTAEIAAVIDVPVGTVRTRLDRARELLRLKLANAGFDASVWVRV